MSHTDVQAEPVVAPQSTLRSVLITFAVIVVLAAVLAAGLAFWWLKEDRARLQQQVLDQSMQMVDLRERLTKVELSLQEKTAALATRDAALAEANRPEIPVRVTFRLAWMGQGLVATIRNVSEQPLNVIAELRESGANANTVRNVSLALDAKGSTEVGYAQGWTITSGQSLTVAASGYRSVTAFAP
jgi:hypothetical protein